MAKAEIPAELEIGKLIEVTPESVAHGGAVVARVADRVVFVRNGVVGERARARVSGVGAKNRFFFADLVSVVEPAPERRQHPWAPASALDSVCPVGGMEFGHLTLETQRAYKKSVVLDQLVRLGGVDASSEVLDFEVAELPGGELGTRTRLHFGVDAAGKVGMYPHQSSALVPVEDFPLALSAINELELHRLDLRGVVRVDVAVSSGGQIVVTFTVSARTTPETVAPKIYAACTQAWGDISERGISLLFTAEKKAGRRRGQRPEDVLLGSSILRESFELDGTVFSWDVSAGGFWQNHVAAPVTLAAAVAELADFAPGETVYDLYAGAGLFTAIAADGVGEAGTVLSVEGSPVTSADARRNFAPGGVSRTERSAATEVEVRRGDVSKVLTQISAEVEQGSFPAPSTVILDPSREGAGRAVIEQVSALAPQKIIYVACDPASLGRDTGYLRQLGWTLTKVQAFDMYPNTHHVETIALFTSSEEI